MTNHVIVMTNHVPVCCDDDNAVTSCPNRPLYILLVDESMVV